MAFADDSAVGLLFRIKANSDGAKKEFAEFRRAADTEAEKVQETFGDTTGVDKFTNSLSNATVGLESGFAAVGALAAGMAALGAATAAAVAGLFAMAKSTSEVGTEIDKMQKLTSLSVESIGAIRAATTQTGESLEQLEEVWEEFVELLSEGNKGAEDATKTLIKLGIDPQKGIYDLQSSFEKAVVAVGKVKDSGKQAALSMEAFGESAGLKFKDTVNEMGGSVEKYTKKLKDMGLIMDSDGVRKAKEFDREWRVMSETVSALGRTFSMEFMPLFTRTMRDFSSGLVRNKEAVQNWGRAVTDVFRLVGAAAETWIGEKIAAALKAVPAGVSRGITGIIGEDQTANSPSEVYTEDAGAGFSEKYNPAAMRKQEEEQEKLRKQREEFAKRESNAQIELLRQQKQKLGEIYEEAKNKEIELRKEGQYTAETLVQALDALARTYGPELSNVNDTLFGLLTAGKTPKEIEAIKGQLDAVQADINQKLQKDIQDAKNLEVEIEKKSADEVLKIRQAVSASSASIFEAETRTRIKQLEFLNLTEAQLANERGKLERDILIARKTGEEELLKTVQKGSAEEITIKARIKALDEEIKQNRLNTALEVLEANRKVAKEELEQSEERKRKAQEYADYLNGLRKANERPSTLKKREPEDGGFFGGLFGEIDTGMEKLTSFGQVIQSLGQMAGQMFAQMAQGIGNMVQQWVLLGKESGASMRKMVATVLAGVAAQAAVLAIFHLAMGFAALTPWGAALYGPAPLHFKASALWGGIAVASALGGRAIAGDSFSNASNAGANAVGGSRGGASEQENRTLEIPRNQPSRVEHTHRLILDRGMIVQTVQDDYYNNGAMRGLIIEGGNS